MDIFSFMSDSPLARDEDIDMASVVGVADSDSSTTMSDIIGDNDDNHGWETEDQDMPVDPKTHKDVLGDTSVSARSTRSAKSNRARSNIRTHKNAGMRHSTRTGARHAAGTNTTRGSRRSPTTGSLRSSRGIQRVSRHKTGVSTASIALSSLGKGGSGYRSNIHDAKIASMASLSVATEEAFAGILGRVSEEPETTTINKETVWAALKTLPGFSFPSLDDFLSQHHPWTTATIHALDTDETDDEEARIESINDMLPLGHRLAAVERLVAVMSCPKITQICGRSLERTRLPNFLRYSFEEHGRFCDAEVRRVSSSSNKMPIAETIQDRLARRFQLGHLTSPASAAAASDSVEMDLTFTSSTDDVAIYIDGTLVARVLMDMLHILGHALRAFNAPTTASKARGKAVARKDIVPPRTIQQMLRAFNKAVDAMENLKTLQAEMAQDQAAANDDMTMEVDLAGLKI